MEIGRGRSARRGYYLDEIAVVPMRRTRGQAAVSTAWQIDAHAFELPLVAAPSDAVVSPATAAEIERLGGLAVLDGEGLWCRYEDAAAELASLTGETAQLQQAYAKPVVPQLLRARIAELRAGGLRIAVGISLIIGSALGLDFNDSGGDGDASLVYKSHLDFFDDGPQKPGRIWSRVGRRPILAGGNSNGDIPMLRYAGGPSRPALRLLVLHDDPDREFDYTAGAEESLQRADEEGWTVVSIKRDWATVFADSQDGG